MLFTRSSRREKNRNHRHSSRPEKRYGYNRKPRIETLENRRLLTVTAQLIKDINLQEETDSAFGPASLVDLNGTLYFSAIGDNGRELWKSDGTADGTAMVKDIIPGVSSGNPRSLTKMNDTLFFAATNNLGGWDLWKSDGTETGTTLLKSGFIETPGQLTAVNGTLFFSARDETHGSELWKSDGTADGTVLVKDICAGSIGSSMDQLTNVNGTLFFRANDGISGDELWKSDGTAAGTVLVKDVGAGSVSSFPGSLTNVNGTLFFTATDTATGNELWKSDGTTVGTVLVKDIRTGSLSSSPRSLTNLNGTLFFSASDGANGSELWKSDGTAAGTNLVKDITPVGGDFFRSFPSQLTSVNGTLFFIADLGTNTVELWKSDGTAAGTVMVKDNPLNDFGHLTNVNGTLYFTADDGINFGNGINGRELWKSDGTAAGTVMVKDIRPGFASSYPDLLTNVNGTLFFTANDGTDGFELWTSDGMEIGTHLVRNIDVQTQASGAQEFTDVDGTAFFSASDGIHGRELWKSDGTAAGTVMVKDIWLNDASGVADQPHLTNINGTLYFAADDGINGRELWKSDGTADGTVMVRDISAGSQSSSPFGLTNVGGVLFFTADDGVNGRELWRSDGTAVGTFMVKDIFPGLEQDPNEFDEVLIPASSNPFDLTDVNGTLFFRAKDGVHGIELWKSDGTAAGTVMIADIAPGAADSYAIGQGFNPEYDSSPPISVNGTLFFQATDGIHGWELWSSDGTASGTKLLADVATGPASANPDELTDVNGVVFFAASNASGGHELWKSDGTTGGTVLVKEIDPILSGYLGRLAAVGNTLFFIAADNRGSSSLWKSDGTASGTVFVKDFSDPIHGSVPEDLTNVDGTLFFSARGGINERDLWKSDGTTDGTVLVQSFASDGGQGGPVRGVTQLANIGGTLFMCADEILHGNEPWILFASPIQVPVDTDTITEDLQTAVSNIQGAVGGSGAAPPQVLISADNTDLNAVVAAVENVAPNNSGPAITIVVSLADGDYSGQTIAVPAGLRLVIDGTGGSVTFVGHSPALLVQSGDIVVNGVTFTNTTDASTILVTGGKLTVRNSTVRETTGGSRAAIEITGGTVDLGTSAGLGGNTIDVRGPGLLIKNSGALDVSAIGNTFTQDGTTLTSGFAIEDLVYDALDIAGAGFVRDEFGKIYVTTSSGSIQRAVKAAVDGDTIYVQAGVSGDYAVGVKLVTVAFQNGATVSQQADSSLLGRRALVVTGTNAADTISFSPDAAGAIRAEITGAPTGSFMPTGRLVAYGLGGDDVITVSGSIALSSWLYGDAGNDRLNAGNGGGLLIGGDGNDQLTGGNGRDVLIGGEGADKLMGNGADDILVAGFTTKDVRTSAGHEEFWSSVLAEWNGTDSFTSRLNNLRGSNLGYSGARLLPAVVDDISADQIDFLNGAAGDDWLIFLAGEDKVVGQQEAIN